MAANLSLTLGFLDYKKLELSPANLRYLDSSEKEKLNRLASKFLQSQFLAGRILAKSLLSMRLGIAPLSVKIRIHPSGRPINTAKMQFSISHSKGLAACVAGQKLLGLDLERRLQRRHYISIAEDFFHESEFTRIKREGGVKALQLFYEYWTIKEAYIKARNMSVGNLRMVPPVKISDRLSITHDNLNIELPPADSGRPQIEAMFFTLSKEYILAIASSPFPRKITIAPDFPLPKNLNFGEARSCTFNLS